MKLFRLFRYTLAFDSPFPERSGLILHLDGEGWGEIAPLPGRSRETLLQAEEQLLSVLNGTYSGPLLPSVAFGLFSARNPFKHPEALPLSALLAGTPEQILEKAKAAAAQGYKSAKVKVSGLPLPIAIELIQHLKPLFSLRVDANRAFSFKDALELCEQCGAEDLDYIEEPTYELEQLAHFPYPFALDESLLELSALPDNPHWKAIVIKPTILALPHVQGKKIVLSSACETGVGILGIASLASTWNIVESLGLDTYRYLPQDILSPRLDFSSGSLFPSPVEVNTALLQEIAHG